MKTTTKFMNSFLIAFALVVLAACQKDNLQDAVIPQDAVAENTTNSSGGTNSTDGTDGTDGSDGTDGTDGENGADGEDGQDGADGADGQDGTDGADGAIGATGPQGPEGPQGEQGEQGETGTANVIYSDWFQPTGWDKTTVYTKTHFNYSRLVPAITQDILDKGTVLVYANLGGYADTIWPDGQVGQLPITITLGGDIHTTWSAFNKLGELKINVVDSANSYANLTTSGFSFRYVIIPGGTYAGKSSVDYSKMSYSEVCAQLNIPE